MNDNVDELHVGGTLLRHGFLDDDLLLRFAQVRVQVEHEGICVSLNLLDHLVENEAKDFDCDQIFMTLAGFLFALSTVLGRVLEFIQLLLNNLDHECDLIAEPERFDFDVLLVF